MAANNFEQVRTYPSPNVGDLIFFEYVDSNLAVHQRPAYGTLHRNQVLYTGYQLVLIDAADDTGRQKWFYAADRIEQEAHNWQVSYPYAGIVTAPRFSCTFIVRRDTYDPPAKGSAHPLDDGDETPDTFERFKGAKLIFETQVSVGFKELDSLYIGIQRIYDKIPTLGEQLVHNIDTTYPYAGLKDFPRRTRSLIVPLQGFTPVAKGTVDPVYSGSKLIEEVEITPNDETIKSLYVVVRRVYDELAPIPDQETFNATIEYPYLSDTRFPRTTRRYVVPRADLATAVIPSAGLNLGGATLAFRRVDRFEGQPEDSLYVLVTVAYDRIPNLSVTSPINEAAFLYGLGFQISRPYGTDEHPRLTWRIPMVKAGFILTPEYTACPIPGYTALLLTDEVAEADKDNASNLTLVRVYDTFPGPTLENIQIDRNNDIPERFVAKRTVEQTRIPSQNTATPDAVAGSPLDVSGTLMRAEVGANGTSQVLYTKGATNLKLEINALEAWEQDSLTGGLVQVTQEVVAAGTPGVPLDPVTGVFSEISPVNPFWSIKTTRKATDLGVGDDSISYGTVVNYTWPDVLVGVNFFAVEAKNGYLIRFGYDVVMKEGYAGPCKALVTESWQPTPFTLPSVVDMQTSGIFFDFPMTRKFSIAACLHPAITLTETVGSNHPTLAPAVTTKTFAATNYIDWPDSIIASLSQQMYRGGYHQKRIVVYKPGT